MKNLIVPITARVQTTFIRSFYLERYGLEATIQRFPHLGGKKLSESSLVHARIQQMVTDKTPFMVARFGSVELQTTVEEKIGYRRKCPQTNSILCRNAGFFPNDEKMIKKFSTCMCEAAKDADIQGIWYLLYEGYAVKHLLPKETLILEARYLEPWFCPDNPWTKALEGKKVLVIHPFAETIRKQYAKRKEIFPQNEAYLPDFDLKVLKAVQTQAGERDARFANWFEALEYMHEQTRNIDFDVALIGCGAYGYPLASMIKKDGRQAIHLGGVLQVLFGIKGRRWDDDKISVVRDMYNEAWTYPDTTETPKDATKIEGGCYW